MPCLQWFAIFTLVASILSLGIVVFTATEIHTFNIVHQKIIVDNINGTLAFGSLGYCLTLSNETNTTCTGIGFLYEIGQFLSNHRIS
jgi:hypothetical protein